MTRQADNSCVEGCFFKKSLLILSLWCGLAGCNPIAGNPGATGGTDNPLQAVNPNNSDNSDSNAGVVVAPGGGTAAPGGNAATGGGAAPGIASPSPQPGGTSVTSIFTGAVNSPTDSSASSAPLEGSPIAGAVRREGESGSSEGEETTDDGSSLDGTIIAETPPVVAGNPAGTAAVEGPCSGELYYRNLRGIRLPGKGGTEEVLVDGDVGLRFVGENWIGGEFDLAAPARIAIFEPSLEANQKQSRIATTDTVASSDHSSVTQHFCAVVRVPSETSSLHLDAWKKIGTNVCPGAPFGDSVTIRNHRRQDPSSCLVITSLPSWMLQLFH